MAFENQICRPCHDGQGSQPQEVYFQQPLGIHTPISNWVTTFIGLSSDPLVDGAAALR